SCDPDRAVPARGGGGAAAWLGQDAAGAVDENVVLRELAAGIPAPAGDAPAAPLPAAGGDPVEARLRAMWEDLLGLSSFGPHDNFFELGGTSLAAFRLLSRIR